MVLIYLARSPEVTESWNVGCPWVPPRNCCRWLGGVAQGQGRQGATSPTIRGGYPPQATTDNWGGLPGVSQGTATDDDGRLQRHFKTRTDEDIQLGGLPGRSHPPRPTAGGGYRGSPRKPTPTTTTWEGTPPMLSEVVSPGVFTMCQKVVPVHNKP